MFVKAKLKPIKFKTYMDAINKSNFLFTGLNGRTQGKIFGRDNDGKAAGGESACIEDVLHAMGCDLFGLTQYEISIQVKEIPSGSKLKETAQEEEET